MVLNSWKLGSCVAVAVALSCPAADGVAAAEAEVPPYFKRLIETGNVKFEFHDPHETRRRYPGHTEFNLQVRHRSSFQFSWNVRRGARHLTIRAKVTKISPRLTHTVTLPDRLDTDRRWNDRLVEHEFDHVAISCDPRIMILVEHLYDGVQGIDRTVSSGPRIDNKFVEQLVNEEVDSRLKAVIAVVKANQKLLDDLTRHGARPLDDRREFFSSLYTGPNLEEAGFPYLAEVRYMLKSEAYMKTKPPYRVD